MPFSRVLISTASAGCGALPDLCLHAAVAGPAIRHRGHGRCLAGWIGLGKGLRPPQRLGGAGALRLGQQGLDSLFPRGNLHRPMAIGLLLQSKQIVATQHVQQT